ncbi:uncharacterized protein [Musca autumnalis]|uniref:uncharacterized protein n=1 Tax=Musca autumnalis TaxID=221902 RepID=UPI003CF98258
MAQGKFKKAKLPESIQKKQKQKNAAFTRRSNAPIQAKKSKFNEHQKIKQAISKTLNKSVEEEIRSRAREGHLNLSKAQEAVAKHNKNVEPSTSNQ